MNRIDRLMLTRLAGGVAVTVAVIFGLVVLAESLDTWRFTQLARAGGPLLGLLGILVGTTRWIVSTLPVLVLIGAISGLLDLAARRELTVIKASGISVWALLRWPLLAAALLGVAVSAVADAALVSANRTLIAGVSRDSALIHSDGSMWLEQQAGDERYILVAKHPHRGGTEIEGVTLFLTGSATGERIEAERAVLADGAWQLEQASILRVGEAPRMRERLAMPTLTTPADLLARFSSPRDLTLFEIAATLGAGVTEPALKSAMTTRLMRLLALPLLLAGAVLIAFAFTAGYRRTHKYGSAVLAGVVLGFVVFVITEMADRAGSAGLIDPGLAALGPALVAIVIGTTVLLFREDGLS
jgi:lipopolysaccharide export system permease protein